jgi:protein-S-isoprenylcysteine O-methyltransferase Ste14
VRELGKQFSAFVTLQVNHQLVQTGIYGWIRHPMYLGYLLVLPGIVLIFRSWLVIPVFVSSAIFVVVRIGEEEKLLAEHFGSEFDAYRRRTWLLLPYLY